MKIVDKVKKISHPIRINYPKIWMWRITTERNLINPGKFVAWKLIESSTRSTVSANYRSGSNRIVGRIKIFDEKLRYPVCRSRTHAHRVENKFLDGGERTERMDNL